MADAGRVIEKLKAQIAALIGETAILTTELEETREQLEAARETAPAPAVPSKGKRE